MTEVKLKSPISYKRWKYPATFVKECEVCNAKFLTKDVTAQYCSLCVEKKEKERKGMTLKRVVKRLRKDIMFQRIYRKHLKRRNRSGDAISLEKCRESALLEFYTLKETTKYEQKPPENTEPEDYYVQIAGTTMLNSRWQELKRIQREKGTSPSTTPDQQLQNYLLSLFKDDELDKREDRTIDL